MPILSNSTQNADVIIIGAGIAGASVAAFLASQKKVVLLEQESQAGYHSTGRSAAIFTEVYGNAVIRALTTASRDYYQNPPQGFSESPLWHGLETYLIGTNRQSAAVENLYQTVKQNTPEVELVSGQDYEKLVPLAIQGSVHSALVDRNSKALDVDAIHQGFLKIVEKTGGRLILNAGVTSLTLTDGQWSIETPAGNWKAPIVVNAAGAWADAIAQMAGAKPLGLTPKRRSVCLVDLPQGTDTTNWPMTVDVDEQFYFKPESGQLLCSPADETPIAPCDVQPEELDIAIGIDRVQKILDLEVRKVNAKWAGLRTFAPDKTPVVGFDLKLPGFFWLAGQGGYGIQTAPAIAKTAASLILGHELPASVTDRGVTAASLSPSRFA